MERQFIKKEMKREDNEVKFIKCKSKDKMINELTQKGTNCNEYKNKHI